MNKTYLMINLFVLIACYRCPGMETAKPVLHLSFDKDFGKAEIQLSDKYKDSLKDKKILVSGFQGNALFCGGRGQFGYFLKYHNPPFKDAPFSLTCWFKSRQSQWLTRLFYYKPSWRSPHGFCIRLNGSQVLLYVGELIAASSSKSNPIQQDTWYFLALVWNGSEWKMYLNGVESETGMDDAQFFKYPGEKVPLHIGGYNINTNNTFQGLIDEIKFYNTPLTKEQVLSLLDKESEK